MVAFLNSKNFVQKKKRVKKSSQLKVNKNFETMS